MGWIGLAVIILAVDCYAEKSTKLPEPSEELNDASIINITEESKENVASTAISTSPEHKG
ncbi:unnamed protein product [Strongylus vulgaris]|uniref:Uncharacterized protein n=1 Tax=Strongylus vulgaris TaxID=40348 RepID=A0A3P7KVC1_STRVU|nr:unnamed protein product [Strongylus vulgaris]